MEISQYAKFLEEKSKEVGSPITVTRFVRFERGEGIEKVEEDFAAEVAKTMGIVISKRTLCVLFF